MAFTHGKDSVVKLDNAGGSITDISAYVNKFSLKPQAAANKTTVIGLESDTFIRGLKGGTISMSGFWDATIHAILWHAYDGGASKSWEFGPAGTTGGAVKFYGECICTSYTPGDVDPDNPVPWSAEFQLTGDVATTTW